MRKLLVISLAIVLGAFLCVSCNNDSTPARSLSGTYHQAYPSTEGYATIYGFTFTSSRVISYDKSNKQLDKGDYTVDENYLKIYWDSGKTATYSITWPYSSCDWFKLGNYTYFKLG